jgi:two-component system, CitB family, sensor kinase
MRFTTQLLLVQIAIVAAVLGLGLGLVSLQIRDGLLEQYQQRALAVARSVAADPALGAAAAAPDQPAVQAIALRHQAATGALFVVVTDRSGLRLAHPDPDRIGELVSTDPSVPLAGGETVAVEIGTLGLSARGKVPLRSGGIVIGEVSVGFAAGDVDVPLLGLLARSAVFAAAALAVGALCSLLLARTLKRRTFGLEPADLADLVREREAVLRGVGDGVLAVDADGRVSMCNEEAHRLLGIPVRAGMAVAELDLPPRLRALVDGTGPDGEDVVSVAGDTVLLARRRPVTMDGRSLGSVLTLRDRTDVERLTDELGAVRSMTVALRAQRHEFANRMHTVLGLMQSGAHDDAVDYLTALSTDPGDATDELPAIASGTLRAFLTAKAAHAAERGVRLAVSEASWLPQKLVAPVEVVTVLGNLVDNALDAAHAAAVRPASVEVDLLADGSQLVLSVVNTGDGVPAERVEHIFVEGVSSRGPGRGLGLAIARRTALRVGGDVVLTSPGGDGVMTVFVAHLPGVLAPATVRVAP